MQYVSPSKTLSFKNPQSKQNSKDSKELKETPTRKREQSIKSVQLKRGSGDNKENIHSNLQLGKLFVKEFELNDSKQPLKHSPAKDPHVKRQPLIKVIKHKKEGTNPKIIQISPTPDLQSFSSIGKPKNNSSFTDSQGMKLKINLKDSVQTKSSYDGKRKLSHQPIPASSEQTKYCDSHPDKQAKYELKVQSEIVYCCSKCAVSLGSKGYQVKRLFQEVSISDREKVLQAFLEKAEDLTPKLKTMVHNFQRMKLAVNSNYDKEIQKHTQYYESIVGMFMNMKREGQTKLRQCKDRIMKSLHQIESTLNYSLDETLYMQNDIVVSINEIMSSVNTIDEEKFRAFMNDYDERLNEYQAKMNDIGHYQPNLPAFQNDIVSKLQSCMDSIPYFRLNLRADNTSRSTEQEDGGSGRQPLPVPLQRPHIDNSLYFSFEGQLRDLKSGQRGSKSKSQPRESQKKDTRDGILKQIANSNAKRPFVSLFSEEPIDEVKNSPNFK